MDVILAVGVDDGAMEPEESERLARRLRAEVAELDVESIWSPSAAPAPAGAKSGDPVTLGAIGVALGASGGALPQLVRLASDWLSRQSARHRLSVTIDGDSLELEQATDEERSALIEAFIRRHEPGS